MQNVIQGHFKHAEIFLYLFVVKKNQLIYRKIQWNIKILKKEISTSTYRHNFSCYQILSKLLGKLCFHVVCFPQIEHYSPLGAVYLLVWCIYSKFWVVRLFEYLLFVFNLSSHRNTFGVTPHYIVCWTCDTMLGRSKGSCYYCSLQFAFQWKQKLPIFFFLFFISPLWVKLPPQ